MLPLRVVRVASTGVLVLVRRSSVGEGGRKDLPAAAADLVLEVCGDGLGGSEVGPPVWRDQTVCYGTTLVVLWFALSRDWGWTGGGRMVEVVFDTLSE